VKRIATTSLGCRVNFQDLDRLAHTAHQEGWKEVPFQEVADLYILNTCTVTQAADRQARKLLRSARRRNPEARIVVTGCYAEVQPDELRALEEVDLVVGNLDKQDLLRWLDELEDGERDKFTPFESIRQARSLEAPMVWGSHQRVRPILKIQDGCNHRCAFCIIPRARGMSRSLPFQHILEQLQFFAQEGIAEVILSGVHIAGFGQDLTPRRSLEELLGAIARLPTSPRIRLSSIEPVDLTSASIEILTKHPERFCRALHMAVQSGCNQILQAMGRRYTREEFEARCLKILQQIPGVGIGLDILVGFPGEDRRAFEQTMELIHRLPIASLHAFPYSERKGTPAATMSGQVPVGERKHRVRKLLALAREKSLNFRMSQVNQHLSAVVVGNILLEKTSWTRCVTDNNLEVLLPLSEHLSRGTSLLLKYADPTDPSPRGRLLEILQKAPSSDKLTV
jgi:threonylcarbamoyladenosine tRNA methylthiotransferase MtaB